MNLSEIEIARKKLSRATENYADAWYNYVQELRNLGSVQESTRRELRDARESRNEAIAALHNAGGEVLT